MAELDHTKFKNGIGVLRNSDARIADYPMPADVMRLVAGQAVAKKPFISPWVKVQEAEHQGKLEEWVCPEGDAVISAPETSSTAQKYKIKRKTSLSDKLNIPFVHDVLGVLKSKKSTTLLALATIVAGLSLVAASPSEETFDRSVETAQESDGVEQASQQALQAQADRDADDFQAQYFAYLRGEAENPAHGLNSSRSVSFDPNKPTIVILDAGHGMDERGTERVKLIDPNNERATLNIREELADLLLEAGVGGSKEDLELNIANVQQGFLTERIEDAQERGYRVDGFFNWTDVSKEFVDELGLDSANDRYRARTIIYDYFHAEKLTLTESLITARLAQATGEQIMAAGTPVVYTRALEKDDPMWNEANDAFEGMSRREIYLEQMRYRVAFVQYMNERYNQVTVSIHADSNPNPQLSKSLIYTFNSVDAIPNQLKRDVGATWQQSRYYGTASNDMRTASLMLPREAPNAILHEAVQLGSYSGRVQGYNIQENVEGARDFAARTLASGIVNTLLAQIAPMNRDILMAQSFTFDAGDTQCFAPELLPTPRLRPAV